MQWHQISRTKRRPFLQRCQRRGTIAGVSGEPHKTPIRVMPTGWARAPLVPIAMAIIGGILLHEITPPYPTVYLVVAISLAVAVGAAGANVGSACLLTAAALLGCAAAQAAHVRFAANDIARFTTDTPRLVTLRGVLVNDPQLRAGADIGRPRPPRMAALLDVREIQTWHGWQPTTGRALLQLHTPAPALRGGQAIELFGKLERPGPAVNPGQFDYENFYRSQRIVASVSASGPATIQVLGDAGPGVIGRLRDAARAALLAGFDADDAESAALLRAMLLGERDSAMSDARELFRKSGTSHYLAVSGLHVGIVGGVVWFLLRVFGAGPRLTIIGGGLTIVGYAILAAPAPPVLRATVLALSVGVGLLLGRRAGGVQLLAGAAIVLLLLAPLDLYRAGFQLSFVTVLGLMLLGEPVRTALKGAGDADVLRRRREHPLVRIGQWLDARMLKALTAAVVAWLAAMPLVAVHFGQFNSWAIPASLAAAPAVVLSLLAGVLKLILTAAVPPGAPLFADVAAWPVAWMRATVGWFADLPAADVPLPTPGLALVLLLYAAVLLAILTLPKPGRQWTTRFGAARWLARAPMIGLAVLVFVLPLTGGSHSVTVDPRPLRVTLLAVGAGQCAAIETPDGRVTLIDAGSSSLGRPLESCIAPFLRAGGHAGVERVIVSHANFDHYNAAADVTAVYDATEVVVGPGFADDARAQPAGRELLARLDHLGRPPREVRPGDVLPLDARTRLRVLWPPADHAALSPNDASLVLRLEHDAAGGTRSILFTGDIQQEAMLALLEMDRETPGLLAADVLVAPHHGSREQATAAFVAAVGPSHVLSSNGRNLARKQADFNSAVGDATLLRTHDGGAITVEVGRDGTVSVSQFLTDDRPTLTYPE